MAQAGEPYLVYLAAKSGRVEELQVCSLHQLTRRKRAFMHAHADAGLLCSLCPPRDFAVVCTANSLQPASYTRASVHLFRYCFGTACLVRDCTETTIRVKQHSCSLSH